MTTQFNNITISVPECEDAQSAYSKLCDVLDAAGFEFATDTYTPEVDTGEGETRNTEELFPPAIM